jgi:hypothetical protein
VSRVMRHAGAVAGATSPGYYGWGNAGSGNTTWNNAYAAQADPHFGKPYYPVRAYAGISPYYGYSGWEDYSGRKFLRCVPGTMTKLDDGQMYRCQ